MKTRHILYLTCICVMLESCNDTASRDQPVALLHADWQLSFIDNDLDSVINAYVKKYNVDPKKKVLSLNIYRSPVSHSYYLTQVRRKTLNERHAPDYIFMHDGRFLVLLQLGGSSLFQSSNLRTKLDSVMQMHGISLAEDSLDYNPPLWEMIKDCEGKIQIRNKSDFVFNYIPCGYEVHQDSLNLSRFSIVKVNGN